MGYLRRIVSLIVNSYVKYVRISLLNTHIKIGAGVLQDELSGVGLVLTVIHIHLKLIRLQNNIRIKKHSYNSYRVNVNIVNVDLYS